MPPTRTHATPPPGSNGGVVDDGSGSACGAASDSSSETTTTATSVSALPHPPLHPASAPATASRAANGAPPPPPSSSSASALIISACDKAGMEGVDREAIDRIILRESGDSAYMRQQRKRDEVVNTKIDAMRRRLEARDTSDPNWRIKVERELAPRIRDLIEAGMGDDPRSTAVVVDMDSFFISCELLGRPELRDVPCCVGSIRSIIATSNYAARRYGVRSAMAGFIGDKLVKELSGGKQTLRFLGHNFDLYAEKSREVRKVLARYDPNLKSYSLDEAYMDLGPYFDLRIGRGWSHERIQEHWAAASRRATANSEEGDMQDDASRGGSGLVCEGGEAPTGEGTGGGAKMAVQSTHDLDGTGVVNIVGRSRGPINGQISKPGSHECHQETECNDSGSKSRGGVATTNHARPQQDDEDEGDEDDPTRRPIPPPSPEDVVAEMRASVHSATGLTCSAGIAPNHMLAKIASDANKPNGQLLVPPTRGGMMDFVRPLKIRKVPGIGRVAEKTLQAFGVFTVRDLYDCRAVVQFLFPPSSASSLLRASLGLGSSSSSPDDDGPNAPDDGGGAGADLSAESRQKGISRERTFRSGRSWAELNDKLEAIARKLADDMLSKDLRGRTLTLKVKLSTFDVLSRCRSLPVGSYYRTAGDVVPVAAELLAEARRNHCGGARGVRFDVRLLGVRCSNLVTREEEARSAGQLSLSRFLSRPPTAPDPDPGSGGNRRDGVSGDDMTNGGECEELFRPSAAAAARRGTTDQGASSRETQQLGGWCRGRASPKEPHDGGGGDRDSIPRHSGCGGGDGDANNTGACAPVVVRCPVCDRALRDLDNVEVNRHVDACLSGRAIRELVRGGQVDADAPRCLTMPPPVVASAVSVGRGIPTRKTEKRLLTDFFADGSAAKRLAS